MNQLIGERDWPRQEVCHLLLDLSLQEGSREVKSIDVRPEEQQARAYRFVHDGRDEGPAGVRQGKSWLQKYREQPEWLEDMALLSYQGLTQGP